MSEIKEACSLLWLIEQSWILLSLISQEERILFEEHLHIDLETIPKSRPQTSKPANRTL